MCHLQLVGRCADGRVPQQLPVLREGGGDCGALRGVEPPGEDAGERLSAMVAVGVAGRCLNFGEKG